MREVRSSSVGTPDDSSTSAGVPFVFPLLLLFVTLIQSRAYDLWSESRVIRKLRVMQERRGDLDLAQHMIGSTSHPQPSIEERFSKLYISLSKGRHRKTGRPSRFLFALFFFLLDFLDYSPLLHDGEFVSESDVVVGMRMMVYVGSLTVFGACSFTLVEWIVVVAVCSLYGISLWFFGGRDILKPTSAGILARKALTSVRITVAVVHLLWNEVIEFIRIVRGTSTHIMCIANAVRTRGGVEDAGQAKRFADMLKCMYAEKDEQIERSEPNGALRGDKGGCYWPWEWCRQTIAPVVMMATNGLMWGRISMRSLPTVVVIETFECLTWMLLIINDTQVEPRLFVELLKVADTATPEAQC